MIIKRNSWHYRMNVWKRHAWRTEKQRTLCGYFWFTIGTMLRIIAFPVIVYAVFFLLGGAIAHDMTNVPFIDPDSLWLLVSYPLTGVIFLASILGICAFAVGVFWVFAKTGGWISKKLKSRPKKEKTVRERGLLASYLKARKAKVCPIIKFEE